MGVDLDGDDEKGEDPEHAKKVKRPIQFMKKNDKKKSVKKESADDWMNSFSSYTSPLNQMTSENDFWKDINSYCHDSLQKYNDGMPTVKEDMLIVPSGEQQEQSKPAPGEVGFAPQQKLGDFSQQPDYQLPSLAENKRPWSTWFNK
jgi:hypothetical protein